MQTQNLAKPEDAIVIGGGVVGLCCAFELQRRGLTTRLLTAPQENGCASWGNAGHIAVEQVEPLASTKRLRALPRDLFLRGGAVSLPPAAIATWLPFALRLLRAARPQRFQGNKKALSSLLAEAMPAWRRLTAAVGAPDLLVENGHLVVWDEPATAVARRAAWKATSTGTATYRDASVEELEAVGMIAGRAPAGGIRFEGSGNIADLPELQARLRGGFEALGGTIAPALVSSVHERPDGKLIVRLSDGSRLPSGRVVIAAGLGSKALMEKLGHAVPMIAERGYHIQSAFPAHWPATLPPVVFEDRSLVVTPFRSGVRATSFVEFVAPDTPPDPRKWERLRRHAAELGLPFASPVEEWTGCRPTLPDYLPAIGRSRRAPNLFYAFGHQHLGLTLAAVTGEIIGKIVAGNVPPVSLSPFDIDRFGIGRGIMAKPERRRLVTGGRIRTSR